MHVCLILTKPFAQYHQPSICSIYINISNSSDSDQRRKPLNIVKYGSLSCNVFVKYFRHIQQKKYQHLELKYSSFVCSSHFDNTNMEPKHIYIQHEFLVFESVCSVVYNMHSAQKTVYITYIVMRLFHHIKFEQKRKS